LLPVYASIRKEHERHRSIAARRAVVAGYPAERLDEEASLVLGSSVRHMNALENCKIEFLARNQTVEMRRQIRDHLDIDIRVGLLE
jgi:hypothetical protein